MSRLSRSLARARNDIGKGVTVTVEGYNKIIAPDGMVYYVAALDTNGNQIVQEVEYSDVHYKYTTEQDTELRTQQVFVDFQSSQDIGLFFNKNSSTPEQWLCNNGDYAFLGTFNETDNYQPSNANKWRYMGRAIPASLMQYIIQDSSDWNPSILASNCIPIVRSYSFTDSLGNPLTVYGSFQVPENSQDKYIAIDVVRSETDLALNAQNFAIPPAENPPVVFATTYDLNQYQVDEVVIYLVNMTMADALYIKEQLVYYTTNYTYDSTTQTSIPPQFAILNFHEVSIESTNRTQTESNLKYNIKKMSMKIDYNLQASYTKVINFINKMSVSTTLGD